MQLSAVSRRKGEGEKSVTDVHESRHIPVLLEESLRFLEPRSGGHYLDCTVGGGSHAEGILERSSPGGRLTGIDRDPQALELARRRLARFGDRVSLIQANFADLTDYIESDRWFDGIVADLGMSSIQLGSDRGFSFMRDEPLDMRMGTDAEFTARRLLNHLSRDELAGIFRDFGEERRSRRIADAVVRAREKAEIRTTADLARVVEKAADPRYRIKSLARIWQALRIAVNLELASLERGLPILLSRLSPGGVLVVISYHSLEDRIVKRFFIEAEKNCLCPPPERNPWCDGRSEGDRLTKKVVRPTGEETQANPRARSARLRAFKRSLEGRAS